MIVRLTNAAWLEYEAGRVRGILLCHLSREGMLVSELRRLIKSWGLSYTPEELVLLRDKLVADGVIEIE